MYLLASFIMENFKKSLQWIHSYDNMPFSGQHGLFVPNESFFRKINKASFMYVLTFLSLCKIAKNPSSGSRVMKTHNFPAQNGLFAPNENFFRKTINIFSMKPLAYFIVQNFKKKSLERIQSYEDALFLGPKWPICPEREFFWKTH